MNRMDRIEAARLIKAGSPEIDILIVSVFRYPAYIIGDLRTGAAGYLLKNAPLLKIIKTIRSISFGETIFDIKANGTCYVTCQQIRLRHIKVLVSCSRRAVDTEICS